MVNWNSNNWQSEKGINIELSLGQVQIIQFLKLDTFYIGISTFL